MCEPLLPIEELEALKFSVHALVHIDYHPGSYSAANGENACRGIVARLDWVIRTLGAANEGKKNMGV